MPFQPSYSTSWALVVGINSYSHASPLGYARQDAEAVYGLLTTQLGFPAGNTTLLCDEAASADAIREAFLRLAASPVGPDDRVFFFFAGHGHTATGYRGEIGYLVPVNGSPGNLNSLIRWDELTRNAELVPAKHTLFIMDACYGGTALTRAAPPGSARFLKDMMTRYARQVITAGKANQLVADSGGPRPGHSVFTGHLLDALEGGATSDGILTANGVMAYVYHRVARDSQSRQTPHFGFLDGDGDFVFRHPPLDASPHSANVDIDLLVTVPPFAPAEGAPTPPNLPELLKELLPDHTKRIRLDDLVNAEIRKAVAALDPALQSFGSPTPDAASVKARLDYYAAAVQDLLPIVVLLSRWGGPEHSPALSRIFSRLADLNRSTSGMYVWLGLRWYSLERLLYAAGISALYSDNMHMLSALFRARTGVRESSDSPKEVVAAIVSGIGEVDTHGGFKLLEGHERHFVPRSEFLFKDLQPPLEDLLFLGAQYEELFDRFEALLALAYADRRTDDAQRVWGPPGRFAWKYREWGRGAYADLLAEAESLGADWLPLKAGLFRGSPQRFKETAEKYSALLQRLSWF